MSHRSGYLPEKEAELVSWAENFAGVIGGKAGLWEIPAGEANALQAAVTDFKDLYEQANSPLKNAVIVENKNIAKEKMVKLIQNMVNFRLQNPIITDADRVELGLHIPNPHGPIPPPATYPEAEVDTSTIRQLTIHFKDNGAKIKAKPHGVQGAEICWIISDHPPASVAELINSSFDTATPFTLVFDETQRGKTVYFCLRWENTKADKGPWSIIYSAIIP